MATVHRTQGFVFRRGNLTNKTFTPRPEVDTTPRPGQGPGLSAFESLQPGEKGQKIDLALLQPPLRAFADDPDAGGLPGHVSIVPVNEAGTIDQQLLDEWAAYRDTDQQHRFTQIVLSAVVETNVRG